MTIALTLEQVRTIFNAGKRRGEEEATAYDWGCSPSGKADDELADALHEIANEGLGFDHPQYVVYSDVPKMFADLETLAAADAAMGAEA